LPKSIRDRRRVAVLGRRNFFGKRRLAAMTGQRVELGPKQAQVGFVEPDLRTFDEKPARMIVRAARD
jgi:hypothetical protein